MERPPAPADDGGGREALSPNEQPGTPEVTNVEGTLSPTASGSGAIDGVLWDVPLKTREAAKMAASDFAPWEVKIEANAFAMGSKEVKKPAKAGGKIFESIPMNLPAVADPFGGVKTAKGKKGQNEKRVKTKTVEVKKTVEADNVWSKAREVLLQERADELPEAPVYKDETEYAAHYRCARKTYRTVADGYQRKLTLLEEETLFLWQAKKIYLEEPPNFITMTHTLLERLVFREQHRDRLGYNLYVQTPPRLKWTAESAKYHFCASLLSKNQVGGVPSQEALNLIQDVHSFTCTPESGLAVLRFVRPDTRNKWNNKTFRFEYGLIRLRISETFEQDDKRKGLDTAAKRMLYSVELLGKPTLTGFTLHAIAKALGDGLPVFDIKGIEPSGSKALGPHVWCITYNSLTAPEKIGDVRCLKIKQGEGEFTIGVHQPRKATRYPCAHCLSVEHYRNKCPLWKEAEDVVAAAREQYERNISITEKATYDAGPAAKDLSAHREILLRMRQTLSPELIQREAEAQLKKEAETSEVKSSQGAGSSEPGAESATVNSDSANRRAAILRAAADRKKAAQAKADKLRAAKAKKAKETAIRGILKAKTKVNKTKLTPKANQSNSGQYSVERCGKSITTKVIEHSAGDKREIASISTSSVTLKEETSDTAVGEPPQQQARTTEDQATVDRTKAKQEAKKVWAPAGGIETQSSRTKFEQLTMTSFCQTTALEEGSSDSSEVEWVGQKSAPYPPVQYQALLAGLGATEVTTSPDGACLYHALIAAQARSCGHKVDGTDSTEIRLAHKLRTDLSTRLHDNLVQLLVNKSLEMTELCSRYLGGKVEADSLKKLLAHFEEVTKLEHTAVDRRFWGGDAEIVAFVEWTGEPVYVLDVWPRTKATFVQRYSPTEYPLSDGTAVLRVIRQGPTPEVFKKHIEAYKKHKVIPLMLLLHHAFDDEQMYSGHFTAARLSGATYRDFVGNKAKADGMKRRLKKVLSDIEQVDAAFEFNNKDTVQPTLSPSSPIETNLGGADAKTPAREQHTEGKTAGPADVKPTTETSGDKMAAVNVMLGPEEQVDSSWLSILDTQTDPSLSWDSDTREIGRCRSQLDPHREHVLLDQMRQLPPYEPEVQAELDKAIVANKTAFVSWKGEQKVANPALHKVVKDVKTPKEASEVIKDRPGALKSLIRRLPFPEVHVATLNSGILRRTGKAAVCLARAQMLHRISPAIPEAQRTFCTQWAAAIQGAQTLEEQWMHANERRRWEKLNKLQTRMPGLLIQQPKLPSIAQEDDWLYLIGYLLVIPGSLPYEFTSRDIPQQCDALLGWTAHEKNVKSAFATASALSDRCWNHKSEVFAKWATQTDDVTMSMTQENEPGAAAPSHY